MLPDSTNTYKLCSETVDTIVRICTWVSSTWFNLTDEGVQVPMNVNGMQHAIWINNFPFRNSSSRLAIKTSYDTMVNKILTFNHPAVDENYTAVDFTDGMAAKLIFTWNSTCEVTSGPTSTCTARVPVLQGNTTAAVFESDKDVDVFRPFSPDDDGFSRFLYRFIGYYTFMTDCSRPAVIEWDPEFALLDLTPTPSPDVSAAPFHAASMFVLTVSFALLTVLMLV